MPGRSKVMIQIHWSFRLGVWRGVYNRTPKKALIVKKLLTIAAGPKQLKRCSKIKDLRVGTWNVLSLYRSGTLPEGTGGVGRPVTWLDSAEEDLKTVSFINFRRKS